jgi:hypothetical protein
MLEGFFSAFSDKPKKRKTRPKSNSFFGSLFKSAVKRQVVKRVAIGAAERAPLLLL